jgi:maleamate amidohydrolase
VTATDHGAMRAAFAARGIGGRVGFGDRPALLVVDVTRAFTDPSSPLGSEAGATVAAIRELVDAARAAAVPIVFTAAVYDDVAHVWSTKIPSNRELTRGTELVDLDPRLDRRSDERLIEKHHASGFFGTDLDAHLRDRLVDTVIVTGLTTSGCVRATVVDACSYGFKVVVPSEAVADRAEAPHVASLFDMDAKYADVVSCDDILQYLAGVRAR